MSKIIIIDKTITVLFEMYNQKLRNRPYIVVELAKLLNRVGATYVEIPYELYCLANIPDDIKVKICNSNEIEINKTSEMEERLRKANFSNFRLAGLDDLIMYDYNERFHYIDKEFGKNVEMCFKNKFYGGTAMSFEWIKYGGETVVTTFSGIGLYTPLEELLCTIRFIDKTEISGEFTEFVKITNLLETMFCFELDRKKSIIGDNIFSVESGVHVDGILKNPENFEPFDPALVGRSRRIVIGKSSGSKSLQMKLTELNIDVDKLDISSVLNEVRNLSSSKGRSLSDEELFLLCEGVK